MYTFTKNIKIFSLSLIILGALGLGYGFYTAPNSVEEAKAMVSNSHGLEEKNDSHDNNKDHAISEDLHDKHGVFLSSVLISITFIRSTIFSCVSLHLVHFDSIL